MMRIDPAIDADIPWILQQLESFASWTGGKHKLFPADPAMAEAIVRNVVRSHVMLVAWQEAADNTRDFERLGLIAGYVTVHRSTPRCACSPRRGGGSRPSIADRAPACGCWRLSSTWARKKRT